MPKPTIYPLSKTHFPRYVLDTINTIQNAGFEAYIVGGAIRDIVQHRQAKDFDIATSATEEQVVALFKRARIVGRRFRVVYLYKNQHLLEITTFRKAPNKQTDTRSIIRDNTHGSIEEDVLRRDFTFNGLYFDPNKEVILDYASGFKDAKSNTLRCIGTASTRFVEDPVRMLRALRFSTKLQSHISLGCKYQIKRQSSKICTASSARLFDELIKNLLHGHAKEGYIALKKYGFIHHLMPHTAAAIKKYPLCEKVLISALENTDQRIRQKKTTTPSFLYAALIYPDLHHLLQSYIQQGQTVYNALMQSIKQSHKNAILQLTIPKRHVERIGSMFHLQYALERPSNKNKTIMSHSAFRAAYDFLELRAQHQPELKKTVAWWHKAQQSNVTTPTPHPEKKPRTRKRR